ncbi:MAG: hypothetical protein E6J79_07750 [Deltaproteobacteria bacterium]|nr:MAG: hypothetical protein E6J79_07750 [Deltaproteobacteria bacterium]
MAIEPVAAIVEQLARFRGSVMVPQILLRRGLPLALAAIDLDDRAALLDLDDPGVLRARQLRPSHVATRQRRVTQPQALALYRTGASGLESLWTNVTLFDRATPRLRVADVRRLRPGDADVHDAAELLGIAPA